MQTASNLDKQQVNLEYWLFKNSEPFTRSTTYETYKSLPGRYITSDLGKNEEIKKII